MPVNEAELEAELQAKGKAAPRLTPADIDAVIAGEAYHVFPDTTLTVCCLTLRNGFCVTGESAAASPENFDEEIGRKIARENARQKVWALEGYLLRERLHGELLREPWFSAGTPPHVQRMILEEKELGKRIYDLNGFILRNPTYATLSALEQTRMTRQLRVMVDYQIILGERIEAATAGG